MRRSRSCGLGSSLILSRRRSEKYARRLLTTTTEKQSLEERHFPFGYENGQRLLQVLSRRAQLAELIEDSAARLVAGQKHRRVFHIFGCGQKIVGEFQSVVQLQLPRTICRMRRARGAG
jgi:hypothetical protein